jgi:hypothetical protein
VRPDPVVGAPNHQQVFQVSSQSFAEEDDIIASENENSGKSWLRGRGDKSLLGSDSEEEIKTEPLPAPVYFT